MFAGVHAGKTADFVHGGVTYWCRTEIDTFSNMQAKCELDGGTLAKFPDVGTENAV